MKRNYRVLKSFVLANCLHKPKAPVALNDRQAVFLKTGGFVVLEPQPITEKPKEQKGNVK